MIIDRILNVEFIFQESECVKLDQVCNFNFNLHKGIKFDCLLKPILFNNYHLIEELKISGTYVVPEENFNIYGFDVSFYNLQIANIKSGLNTESTMTITLKEYDYDN